MTALQFREASAYDALAPIYDLLTASYDHEGWIAGLERLAAEHGVHGGRLLDVACGTGRSTQPWLERGYEVTACDGSRAMLEVAERNLGTHAELLEADMRALPVVGAFELVTCLDDAVNHLLAEDEVADALAGIAANLAPGGLAIFDVNTLPTLREAFSTDWALADDDEDVMVVWRGTGPSDLAPGGVTQAAIEVFRRERSGSYGHERAVVRERHYSVAALRRAMARAGLEPLAVRGQLRGARLQRQADEERHHKLVVVARRRCGVATWLQAHGYEGRLP